MALGIPPGILEAAEVGRALGHRRREAPLATAVAVVRVVPVLAPRLEPPAGPRAVLGVVDPSLCSSC